MQLPDGMGVAVWLLDDVLVTVQLLGGVLVSLSNGALPSL